MHWQKFGSYLGLTLLLIYTGRRYYGQVLKRALAFLPAPEADAAAVWACRFLILAVAAMVFLLARAGLDWPLGLLAVCTFLMMFLVMARINAESGLFYLQPYWQPMMLFLGLFGFAALGPRTVALLALLCAVFTIDPRECLMPFVVNALRICDRLAIRPAGVGWASAGVFALALAVAVPLVLWANYNYGMFTNDTWAADRVPNMTYQVVERSVTTLTPAEREQADRRTAWSRLRAMRPNRRFLVAAGAGVGLVLLLSALRLRLARFPLHPIMFLVWGTYPLGLFSHSFLLGWLIKRAVTRYGGGHAVYRKATAFMFGVVAGDLLGGLIFMAVGALYYAVTGFAGPEYRIFPS